MPRRLVDDPHVIELPVAVGDDESLVANQGRIAPVELHAGPQRGLEGLDLLAAGPRIQHEHLARSARGQQAAGKANGRAAQRPRQGQRQNPLLLFRLPGIEHEDLLRALRGGHGHQAVGQADDGAERPAELARVDRRKRPVDDGVLLDGLDRLRVDPEQGAGGGHGGDGAGLGVHGRPDRQRRGQVRLPEALSPVHLHGRDQHARQADLVPRVEEGVAGGDQGLDEHGAFVRVENRLGHQAAPRRHDVVLAQLIAGDPELAAFQKREADQVLALLGRVFGHLVQRLLGVGPAHLKHADRARVGDQGQAPVGHQRRGIDVAGELDLLKRPDRGAFALRFHGEHPQRGAFQLVVVGQQEEMADGDRPGADAAQLVAQVDDLLAVAVGQRQDVEIGVLGDQVDVVPAGIDCRRYPNRLRQLHVSGRSPRLGVDLPQPAALIAVSDGQDLVVGHDRVGVQRLAERKAPAKLGGGGRFEAGDLVADRVGHQDVALGGPGDGRGQETGAAAVAAGAHRPPPEDVARGPIQPVDRAPGQGEYHPALHADRRLGHGRPGQGHGGRHRRGRVGGLGRLLLRHLLDGCLLDLRYLQHGRVQLGVGDQVVILLEQGGADPIGLGRVAFLQGTVHRGNRLLELRVACQLPLGQGQRGLNLLQLHLGPERRGQRVDQGQRFLGLLDQRRIGGLAGLVGQPLGDRRQQ